MSIRIYLALFIIQMVLGTSSCAKPGDLDTSFGGNGKITTAIGESSSYAGSVAIQNDGKIVVAGKTNSGNYDDFAIVRYNIDGALDSSFGIGGKVVTAIGSSYDEATSVAIQNDGRIVAAGTSYSSKFDFAIVRYNIDGTLDTSFGGGDGKVTTAIGSGTDQAYSVAIQNDGKIVAAGYGDNGKDGDFAIVRYNSDGTLDSSFGGGDGKVTTAIGSGMDSASDVAIQNDGKIVAVGYTNNGSNWDFAIVRYNSDGALDSSFGNGGKVTVSFGSNNDKASSVAIQSNGKIVTAGYSDNGSIRVFAIVRHNSDGTLNGYITTSIGGVHDEASSVAIQSNGKIVTAGYSDNGGIEDFAIVRYDSNGALDSTFGNGGKVTTDIGSGGDKAFGVAIQNDGKIVTAGFGYNGGKYDFATVRYLGDPIVPLAPIYYLLQ